MNGKKLPGWLTIAGAAAAILGNAALLLLIFRIEGRAFAPVLAAYAVLLCLVCGILLRRRDLKRLSAELQISEEEVFAMIRDAKRKKKRKIK